MLEAFCPRVKPANEGSAGGAGRSSQTLALCRGFVIFSRRIPRHIIFGIQNAQIVPNTRPAAVLPLRTRAFYRRNAARLPAGCRFFVTRPQKGWRSYLSGLPLVGPG